MERRPLRLITAALITTVAYWCIVWGNVIALRYTHCGGAVHDCAKVAVENGAQANHFLIQSAIVFGLIIVAGCALIFWRYLRGRRTR